MYWDVAQNGTYEIIYYPKLPSLVDSIVYASRPRAMVLLCHTNYGIACEDVLSTGLICIACWTHVGHTVTHR